MAFALSNLYIYMYIYIYMIYIYIYISDTDLRRTFHEVPRLGELAVDA